MRTGYLGGSFDPVHFGHLILAEACREAASLDEVVFLVAGRPPHKSGLHLAPAEARAELVRLATTGNPAFRVDDREIRREGPSFTIDSLTEIAADAPAGEEHFFLIGSDTLPQLSGWRAGAALVDRVRVLTAVRPGHDVAAAIRALRPAFGPARTRRLADGLVQMPLIDISSTDIRCRIREGRSIRYLVPEPVRLRIHELGLYSK